LSVAEREEISRGMAAGEPVRDRPAAGRCASAVCPEVTADGGRERYRACAADRRAVRLMRRPKPAKLAACPRLREVVEGKLELRWSPQQIAAWLAVAFPDDPEMRVSHETIYLSLFVDARGALRKELFRPASGPGLPPPAGPDREQRPGQDPRHGQHLRAAGRGQ
jgi:transposase, IS30 family